MPLVTMTAVACGGLYYSATEAGEIAQETKEFYANTVAASPHIWILKVFLPTLQNHSQPWGGTALEDDRVPVTLLHLLSLTLLQRPKATLQH